jgi:bromodomain-containing factor 1
MNFNEDFHLKRCTKILGLIKTSHLAGPFLYPVDPIALNIPTYLDIIKTPMDLHTVEEKLKNFQYANDKEFDDDLMTIWSNAKTFNGPMTEVYQMADKLE